MIKLILIDDHQLVIDGIMSLLDGQDDIQVLAQANNGMDGFKYVEALRPDLILLDLDMPIMNGMVTAEKIKKEIPDIKVIILSLHQESSIIKHLIKLGIDGYLLKTTQKDELLAAIRQVATGRSYFGPDVTLALTRESNATPQLVSNEEDIELLASLTDREKEVLVLIAEGQTNKEIASQLHLSARTIDAHRASIMQKLQVKNVVGLVKFAMRCGLVA